MNNTIKYVVVASLILSVIAIGVAMTNKGQDGRNGINGKDGQSLGGVTKYDEIGSNNVAEGWARIVSTSTTNAKDMTSTAHRVGWTNNVRDEYGNGVDVIVSASDLFLELKPQGASTSQAMSTTSSYVVWVATSTSETAASPVTDFDGPIPTYRNTNSSLFLVNRWFIASSSEATTSNALAIAMVAKAEEEASTTPSDSGREHSYGRLASTTKNIANTVIVPFGAALQMVIGNPWNSHICGDSAGGSSGQNMPKCTAASSSERAFQLEMFFKYRFHNSAQPEP